MTTVNNQKPGERKNLQTEIPIQYQTFKDWFESLPANKQKNFQNLIMTRCNPKKGGISYETFRLWVRMEHSPKQEDRNIINDIAGRILTYPEPKIRKVRIA